MTELERLYRETKTVKSPLVQQFRGEVALSFNEMEQYIAQLELDNFQLRNADENLKRSVKYSAFLEKSIIYRYK